MITCSEVLRAGIIFPGNRLKAWQIANRKSLKGAPLLFRECATRLPDDIDILVAEIRAMLAEKGWTLELVILDTLNRTLNGDENSAKDFAAYQRALDRIRDEFGCADLFIHHTGHDKSKERGTYAIRGNVDVSLSMEVISDTTRRLHAHKIKDAEAPEDIFFALNIVHLGEFDDEGNEIKSVTIRNVSASDPESTPAVNKSVKTGKTEKAMLLILEELVDTHKDHLEASGYDPQGARVTLKEWRQVVVERGIVTSKQHFYKTKDSLVCKKLIVIDSAFAGLSPSQQSQHLRSTNESTNATSGFTVNESTKSTHSYRSVDC